MKKIVIITSLVLGQLTMAAPMYCRGGNWEMEVDNYTRATLTHQGENVLFGDLKCKVVTPRTSDKQNLVCITAKPVADAGYSAVVGLKLPGITMYGQLTEQTFAGPRKLADLTCVAAAH